MTVPKWNDDAWARTHGIQEQARPRTNRTRLFVLAAAVLFVTAGVATATTDTFSDSPEKILVCHATGEGGNYVLLSVAEDSFEHGHHRHHDQDYFLAAEAVDCVATGAQEEAAESDTEVTVDADLDTEENVTEDAAVPDAVPEADNGTGTQPEPEQEPTTGNASEPESEPDAEPEPEQTPGAADLKVSQIASQDDEKISIRVTIENIGSETAQNVSLADSLPDVGRGWYVTGVSGCTFDEDDLSCWFGDVESGETLELLIEAYTDQMLCGEPATNTVSVSADNDAEQRNNAASAGIAAKAC